MRCKVYKAELFELDSESNLVAEISELSHKTSFEIRTHIDIQNQDESVDTYQLKNVDRNSEDIYGWNYVCPANGKKLLIIND